MPLTPLEISTPHYFYPHGFTQPVCLTESLPPEYDANVLILGSVDVRNILFTTYGDAGHENRVLDFTSCEIDAYTVARNTLLLALILDQKKDVKITQLWNIYFHVFINAEDAQLLQTQARELLCHSESLEAWNQGPFSDTIRFCDSATLAEVVKLWKIYAVDQSQAAAHNDIQKTLKKQWKATEDSLKKKEQIGIAAAFRCCLPFFHAAFEDGISLQETFWRNGTIYEDKKIIKTLNVANQMFHSGRSNYEIYYGTAPVLSLPIATAYAQLSSDSPLAPSGPGKSTMAKAFNAAIAHWDTWCQALRQKADRVITRWVYADQLSFCQVLQHQHAPQDSHNANWSRSSQDHTPLILDSADYCKDRTAPTTFDVIDTTTMAYADGALIVLATCSPLLRPRPSSVIRTEVNVPREGGVAKGMQSLLCGDVPTVALLLGLKPVHYWSNAAPTWYLSDSFVGTSDLMNILSNSMCYPVFNWKYVDTTINHYDSGELTGLLFDIFLQMYPEDLDTKDFDKLVIKDDNLLRQKISEFLFYTPASFPALLNFIKNRTPVDLKPIIENLLARILADRASNMDSHHFQSMIAHLEVFSLIQPDSNLNESRFYSFAKDLQGLFSTWINVPPVVYVTFIVPRKAIAMWDHPGKGNGTPVCEMQVLSTLGEHNIYPDVQLGFGTVETFGTPFTNDLQVKVHNNGSENAPLVVSALVATCDLVESNGTSAGIIFQLTNTSKARSKFVSKLGPHLQIHKSVVGAEDVLISRFKPNMQGHPTFGGADISHSSPDIDKPFTLKPRLHTISHKVHIIQVYFKVKLSAFIGPAQVSSTQITFVPIEPFIKDVYLKVKWIKRIELPFPTAESTLNIRPSGEWVLIEYAAAVSDFKTLAAHPNAIFRFSSTTKDWFILENLSYVNMSTLPKFDLNKERGKNASQWLSIHAAPEHTMNHAEDEAYKHFTAKGTMEATTMPGRLAIKKTLYLMLYVLFMNKHQGFFGISHKGIVCLMLWVNSVHLDTSNQSILIDAAWIINLDTTVDRVQRGIFAHDRKIRQIDVGEDELRFWKAFLCASAERCRTRSHTDNCQYRGLGRVPVSFEHQGQVICACLYGGFPKGYLPAMKNFEDIAECSVRVALPLVFASPISPSPAGLYDNYERAPVLPGEGSRRYRQRHQVDYLVIVGMEGRPEGMTTMSANCLHCGADKAEDGKDLLQCARCQVARYCSRSCQKDDWKEHKRVCKKTDVLAIEG